MTDTTKFPHSDLMRLADSYAQADGLPVSDGVTEQRRTNLDAHARTLTDRIAELEAQIEAVDAGGVMAVNMSVAPEDTASNRREIATNPGSAIALMQGLQRKIAELKATQPAPAPAGTWTAVKDGLPADGTEVTVQMFGGQVRQVVRDGSFCGGWKQVNCAGWECVTMRKDGVTHWHPAILPRPEMTSPTDAPWMIEKESK